MWGDRDASRPDNRLFSSSGCVWTIKGTLPSPLPPQAGSALRALLPLAPSSPAERSSLVLIPRLLVCPGRSPSSGLVWFQLGGLHSLAGAHWGCPDGHLERCVTGVPCWCWCFCSCCFTCWMISLIFLCAVCGSRGEYVYLQVLVDKRWGGAIRFPVLSLPHVTDQPEVIYLLLFVFTWSRNKVKKHTLTCNSLGLVK